MAAQLRRDRMVEKRDAAKIAAGFIRKLGAEEAKQILEDAAAKARRAKRPALASAIRKESRRVTFSRTHRNTNKRVAVSRAHNIAKSHPHPPPVPARRHRPPPVPRRRTLPVVVVPSEVVQRAAARGDSIGVSDPSGLLDPYAIRIAQGQKDLSGHSIMAYDPSAGHPEYKRPTYFDRFSRAVFSRGNDDSD